MPARCRDSIKPLEESTFSASRKAVREAAWTAPPPRCDRGFGAIYASMSFRPIRTAISLFCVTAKRCLSP